MRESFQVAKLNNQNEVNSDDTIVKRNRQVIWQMFENRKEKHLRRISISTKFTFN